MFFELVKVKKREEVKMNQDRGPRDVMFHENSIL